MATAKKKSVTNRAPAKKKPAVKKAPARKAPARKPAARKRTSRAVKTEEQKIAERIAKAKKICELYENGTHTLESCCGEVGVSYDTFFNWRRDNTEIQDLYEKAMEEHRRRRFHGMKEKALNSFERLITGYEYEETQTEVKPSIDEDKKQTAVVTKIVKTKKHVGPNPGMVAMGMRNWHGLKDRVTIDGIIKHENQFSDEDIQRIAAEVVAAGTD